MIMLVLGALCLVAGVVLLLVHLPAAAVIAFVVGLVLVLASFFRRRGSRASAADAAVLGSINS